MRAYDHFLSVVFFSEIGHLWFTPFEFSARPIFCIESLYVIETRLKCYVGPFSSDVAGDLLGVEGPITDATSLSSRLSREISSSEGVEFVTVVGKQCVARSAAAERMPPLPHRSPVRYVR